MKRITVILTALGAFVFLGFFMACTSVSAGAGYLAPVVKRSDFERRPFGGFGFVSSVDSEYTRFTLGIHSESEKQHPDAPAPDIVYATFFGKYPIELGGMTVYPLAGYGMPFGLTAGAGIDIPIATVEDPIFLTAARWQFDFRGEVTYGFGGYTDDIGKIGALAVNVGMVWTFNAGGVNVTRQFEDKTLAIEDHAYVMVGSYVRILNIDGTQTNIESTGALDRWVTLPPGTHTLIGVRMSSYDNSMLAPEISEKAETGGKLDLYYFRSMDVDENGLQDAWVGPALLEKGHYYVLIFMDEGLVPTLSDITYMSGFSKNRAKVNKTLGIK
jgi:hypothetical protein